MIAFWKRTPDYLKENKSTLKKNDNKINISNVFLKGIMNQTIL